MPFRDHFRPPVSKRHSWEEVHGGWPMMIVQKLAPSLPEGYQAAPRVHLGSYFEVDVGAFENDDAPRSRPLLGGNGGVATSARSRYSRWKLTEAMSLNTRFWSTMSSRKSGWSLPSS